MCGADLASGVSVSLDRECGHVSDGVHIWNAGPQMAIDLYK